MKPDLLGDILCWSVVIMLILCMIALFVIVVSFGFVGRIRRDK